MYNYPSQNQSSIWILFNELSQALFLLLSQPSHYSAQINANLALSWHLKSYIDSLRRLVDTKGNKHFQRTHRFSSRFGLPIHDHHNQMLEPTKTTTKMAAELEDGTNTPKKPRNFSVNLEETTAKQTLRSQEKGFCSKKCFFHFQGYSL